ncbi:MAG TPA: hypothetical protein VFV02_07985 [Acidimicrobiales bacterium]|nr:hypothetical protein [Acidimicrobiales bacterium]
MNGFTMGSTPIDAWVSFALGGVLMLIGLVMVLRGGMISRALGFLVSILAIIWAALIVFLLSSFKHDIDHLAPAMSFARDLQVGYFLLAGGALSAFLGGLVGITVPRKKKVIARSQPLTVPMSHREPIAGVDWPLTPPPAPAAAASTSGAAATRDSRTPVGVGSGR